MLRTQHESSLRDFFAEVVPNASIRDVNTLVNSLMNDTRVTDPGSIACLPLVDLVTHGVPIEIVAALMKMCQSRMEPMPSARVFMQRAASPPRQAMVRIAPRELNEQNNEPKLFVGNLPKDVSENELMELFQKYLDVDHVYLMRSQNPGRGQMCAFVRYHLPAHRAIQTLNGTSALGQERLLVDWPKAATTYPADMSRKIFVGNLPENTTEDEVHFLVEKFGKVEEVSPIVFKGKMGFGCCFVKFEDPSHTTQRCIDDLSGKHYMRPDSEPIVVRPASNKAKDGDIRAFPSHEMFEATMHDMYGGTLNSMGAMHLGQHPMHHERPEAGHERRPRMREGDDQKIFVGNLQQSVTKEDVKMWFAEYGQILEVHMMDSQKSKTGHCCAFVKYRCPLNTCIEELHQKPVLRDSPIEVRQATGTDSKIFVGSLPADVTKEELQQLFSRYGIIEDLYIMDSSKSKNNFACAFVRFQCPVTSAINGLHGVLAPNNGEPLVVRLAGTKADRATKRGRFQ